MDRRLGVRREGLLGRRALRPQAGHRGADGWIGGVELAELPVEGGVDVGQHGVVDVDPAEAFQPLGGPEQLGTVVAVADDGGVEGPAPEVEHGHGLARLEPAEAGVVPRCGGWFGHQLDVVDPGHPGGLPQQVELELAPVRWVGQRDGLRPFAELGFGGLEDVAEELGHQCFGAVRDARQHVWRAVAEAPLELAGTGGGIGRHAPLGGVADDERAIGAGHDRRCGDGVRRQLERFAPCCGVDGSGGPRGSEVDSESHFPSCCFDVERTVTISAGRRADSRSAAPKRRPRRRSSRC